MRDHVSVREHRNLNSTKQSHLGSLIIEIFTHRNFVKLQYRHSQECSFNVKKVYHLYKQRGENGAQFSKLLPQVDLRQNFHLSQSIGWLENVSLTASVTAFLKLRAKKKKNQTV